MTKGAVHADPYTLITHFLGMLRFACNSHEWLRTENGHSSVVQNTILIGKTTTLVSYSFGGLPIINKRQDKTNAIRDCYSAPEKYV